MEDWKQINRCLGRVAKPGRMLKVQIIAGSRGAIQCLDDLAEFWRNQVNLLAVHSERNALRQSTSRRYWRIVCHQGNDRASYSGQSHSFEFVPGASRASLLKAVAEADLNIILASLGGETSSVLCPYLAMISRFSGAVTMCAVSYPFAFEGKRHFQQARSTFKTMTDICEGVTLQKDLNAVLNACQGSVPIKSFFNDYGLSRLVHLFLQELKRNGRLSLWKDNISEG